MNEIESRPHSSLKKDDDFDDLDKELETYIGQHEEKSNKETGVINVSICTYARENVPPDMCVPRRLASLRIRLRKSWNLAVP